MFLSLDFVLDLAVFNKSDVCTYNTLGLGSNDYFRVRVRVRAQKCHQYTDKTSNMLTNIKVSIITPKEFDGKQKLCSRCPPSSRSFKKSFSVPKAFPGLGFPCPPDSGWHRH